MVNAKKTMTNGFKTNGRVTGNASANQNPNVTYHGGAGKDNLWGAFYPKFQP